MGGTGYGTQQGMGMGMRMHPGMALPHSSRSGSSRSSKRDRHSVSAAPLLVLWRPRKRASYLSRVAGQWTLPRGLPELIIARVVSVSAVEGPPAHGRRR